MKTKFYCKCIILALLLGAHQASAQVSFASPAEVFVGSYPWSVAAADVNGDGKLDLICANYLGSTLSVVTNNGSGGFSSFPPSPTYAVGTYPECVIATDIKRVGKFDLICANEGDNTISILTNNGSGIFGSNVTLHVGQEPMSVVAFTNTDGNVDLASANYGQDYLSYFTNNGSGIFASAGTLNVGNAPDAVMAADVNGDGRVDLICANFVDDTLTVLTNNGSRGFATAGTYGVGSGPISIAVADINADGKPDLICANYYDSTLSVLTNNGSGVFGNSSTNSVTSTPSSVIVADVNGDGRPDLISTDYNYSSGDSLTVLTNAGNGLFIFAATLDVGQAPRNVMAADLNGDGKPDLIAGCLHTGALWVLLNTTVFPTLTPVVDLTHLGTNWVVSWPVSAQGFVLQTNGNLGTTNWVTYGGVAMNNSVTNSWPAKNMFFRLLHP